MPWQYDKKEMHDGRNNTYTFEKDGEKHTFLPLKDEGATKEVSPKVLLVSGKEFLQEIKNEEVYFALVDKTEVIPTSTNLNDLPKEVKKMLDEFAHIMVDDFPSELSPIRSINHHIDLIPRTNLPNKEAYRMTPEENEEIKN